jgi:hypothetical protein
MPSPIVLFVYNRLWHTQETIKALKANTLADQSDLIIYSDGFKSDVDKNSVADVRKYIKNIEGFKSVKIVKQKSNLGLANSIIFGVTEVLDEYGEIIVLEDDMVSSPYLLEYFDEALDKYKNDDRVVSIHAYTYPIANLPETFFLRGADCWGWATWARSWSLFESDGKKLLSQLKEKKLVRRFDFEGNANYTGMLEDQIKRKNDSWAVRWYASALLSGGLTLYPGKSLIKNIGLDDSGTHCKELKDYDVDLLSTTVSIMDISVKEDLDAYNKFCKYLSKTSMKQNFILKMIRKLGLR